jgi:hypothetical protein
MPKHIHHLILVTSSVLKINSLDENELTRAEIEECVQMKEVAHFHRNYVPECENSYLAETKSCIKGSPVSKLDDVLLSRK